MSIKGGAVGCVGCGGAEFGMVGTGADVVWLRKTSASNGSRSQAAIRRFPSLFEGINGQAAEELGIEISGFLRQDFAGKSYVPHLLHSYRIHEEGHVSIALPNHLHSFIGIADIGNVLLVAN